MPVWSNFVPPTSERPYRVYPQVPNPALGSDTDDLSVIYRIQGEYSDFRIYTGSGILIRSAYTEPLY